MEKEKSSPDPQTSWEVFVIIGGLSVVTLGLLLIFSLIMLLGGEILKFPGFM